MTVKWRLAALIMGLVPAFGAAAQSPAGASDQGPVGHPLSAWHEGELDIHRINTGRGEASFFLFPDGTNLLVDTSGKTVEGPPFSLPTRPDASRSPGEWVARYLERLLPKRRQRIDYVLLSHFHGDHMGAVVENSLRAREGGYQLSGVTEIAEHLPIGTILDRGWPDYRYPAPLENRNIRNYRAFLDWQIMHRGLRVERFSPGRSDQISLLHKPAAYPQFEVRNLMANGIVWTGEGSETRSLFPPLSTLDRSDYPDENRLSIAFRLSYGKFDYFTGGDLSSFNDEALSPAETWKNVETPVARASGAVDAMKANHHGSWDANSAAFLAALRPRVIVVGSRADGHPAVNTYKHMTSQANWRGPRDIFVTNVSPATFRTTYGIEEAASTQGHIVIRVDQGGASYRVFVLDDSDEAMCVKTVFGPYASQ